MSVIRKLAGETVYYGLSSILGRFISFLITPLYTYSAIIDQNDMGQLTELMSYTAIFLILFTCRFEASYFRFGKDKEMEEKAFSSALSSVTFLSIGLGVLLLVGAPYFASVLGYEDSVVYFRMLAIIMMFDALCEIPLSRLRFEGKAKRFAVIKIINILINLMLNVFFVLVCPWLMQAGYGNMIYWFDPAHILAYIFLANVLASATTFFLLRKDYVLLKRPDPILLRKMILYSWPLVIVSLVAMFNEMFGRIILKWFLTGTPEENEAALGVYGVNIRLTMIIALFTQAFRYAAEPFFFKQSNEENAYQTYADVAKYYLIFCIIGFLTVTLFIDVFKWFIGPRYYEGLVVVPILLLANILSGLYFNISIWYRLQDKTRTGAGIAILGTVVIVFFNWLLVPRMGYMGSAWATLLCYLAMTVVCFLLGRQSMPVPYAVGRWALLLGVAIALQVIFYRLRSIWEEQTGWILFVGLVFMLLYLGFLWRMERLQISRILKSFQKR